MKDNLKRKHVTLTIQQKLHIIELVEGGGCSRQAIAKEFGVGKTTVHDIHKNRDNIRTFAAIHNEDDVKKRRRVDQRLDHAEDVLVIKDEDGQNSCENEDQIDCIEEYDYQDINGEDYEIVYESNLANENDEDEENLDKPKKLPAPSQPIAKRKSKTLTFREKYEVIQQISKGISVPVICKAYGIGRTTAYDYIKRKQEIIDYVERTQDDERRTFKKSKFPEVEERLVEWCEMQETFTKVEFFQHAKGCFEEARCNGLVTSDFCGSWSWAKRFFHRHPHLKRKLLTVHGEPIDPSELSISQIENLGENDEFEPKINLNSNETVKKQLKFLNLMEKLQVLDDLETGNSVASTAEKFNVSKTTIYDTYRRKDDLRARTLTKASRLQKVQKTPRYQELEDALLQWCIQHSFSLTNQLIIDKARSLFDELGLEGVFNTTKIWVKRFVLRNSELAEKLIAQDQSQDDTIQEPYSYEEYTEEVATEEEEEATEEEEGELNEALEFMKHERQSPECVEEYIVEELDESNFDEDLEEEPETEEPQEESRPEIENIKVEKVHSISVIPEKIALKSLDILIKYSKQNGHIEILSHLMEYEEQLKQESRECY